MKSKFGEFIIGIIVIIFISFVGIGIVGTAMAIVGKKQNTQPTVVTNIVVNIGEEDDQGEVNLRKGDILVIKLRVKEDLKKTHVWQGSHEALTALATSEPVYEFSPGYLPGDDNYQLLIYRVNRQVSGGCVLLWYAPPNGYFCHSLKHVAFHLRERK